MVRTDRRRSVLLASLTALLVAACGPASPTDSGAGSEPAAPPSGPMSSPDTVATREPGPSGGESPVGVTPLTSDPLHLVELYDVNSETAFTLGELVAEEPVLLEPMAIWCTNCRAQQGEVREAHDLVAFTSVSLDVDPNERPGDLATYSESLHFAWRFAMANQSVASALRDRFGAAVLNPPSTPKILLFSDGSVRILEFRAYSAAELAAEIAAG